MVAENRPCASVRNVTATGACELVAPGTRTKTSAARGVVWPRSSSGGGAAPPQYGAWWDAVPVNTTPAGSSVANAAAVSTNTAASPVPLTAALRPEVR